MEKIKKKILITGSTGMLGQDLISQLGCDYKIGAVDLKSPPGERGNFFCIDICNQQQIEQAFLKFKPWLVIHAAAYTDVDGCQRNPDKARRINTEGTKNIASLCKRHKVKLLYISTDYVFDGKKGSPYKENDAVNPLNIYGHSKLQGEKFIQTNLDEFLIVRTSGLFGYFGNNFVDTIIKKAQGSEPLKVVDDQISSPTYTVSLSRAIDRLIKIVFLNPGQTEKLGIYHISNQGSCSWHEFAKAIINLKKFNIEIVPIDSSVINQPAERPKLSILDNSRYEQAADNKLCSWQEALEKYLALRDMN